MITELVIAAKCDSLATMADSTDHNQSLHPANEIVAAADIDAVLEQALSDGRYALAWCQENDLDLLARPLRKAMAQTTAYSIRSSNSIGDAGFHLDEKTRTIFLSVFAINAIIASIVSISTSKGGNLLENPLVIAGINLYVFHELTHVSQQFIKHEQAGEIKEAFGKDIFSMIDCITDVKSAHCVTIISMAFLNKYSKSSYVDTFSENIVLSYHLLVTAFSIKDADHKRKRALGLLSTSAICDVATECSDENRNELLISAMTPIYASLVPQTGRIMGICPESGDIVFTSSESSNSMTATELWESLENISIGDAKGFLRRAFTESFYQRGK